MTLRSGVSKCWSKRKWKRKKKNAANDNYVHFKLPAVIAWEFFYILRCSFFSFGNWGSLFPERGWWWIALAITSDDKHLVILPSWRAWLLYDAPTPIFWNCDSSLNSSNRGLSFPQRVNRRHHFWKHSLTPCTSFPCGSWCHQRITSHFFFCMCTR